jgi:acyl-coenzyme A synthetase/AMP-(fatty) acid ligase
MGGPSARNLRAGRLEAFDKIYQFARETPDAVAMVYDLEPISYRRFYRMISAMRRRLSGYGLRPGGVAVLWIYSGRTGWVVNLALRSLGLTTVSIRGPAEFAGFTGMDIVAVVTSADEHYPPLDHGLASGAARIVVEARDWDLEEDSAELEPPPMEPAGDQILLTSATTGTYKMIRLAAEAQGALIQTGTERFQNDFSMAAQAFSQGLNLLNLGLWTAAGGNTPLAMWRMGGSVIIHQGPEAWRSMCVPGIAGALVTSGALGDLMAEMPDSFERNDSLILVVTGGSLSTRLARDVRARLTPVIISLLGSTETGSWGMTPVATDEDLLWHRLHPGRTVEVVDENDQPLPPGQLGQVRVLVEGSFTGYLNDSEASSAFLKGGFFYPGDLGVLDGNGRVSLYGRVTDVLNIKGDKLPAAPYERALQDALGLNGVCVLSEPDDDREEQLHVVLETAEPMSEDRLREAALAHLRGFPAARFHFLPRFPRNHMGKVERLKLKQQLIEQQRSQGAAMAAEEASPAE